METISVRVSPKVIAFVLIGAILLIAGALSLSARHRENDVATWGGTIASSAATSTTPVQMPVTIDQAPIVSVSTNQSELLPELNRYWVERINRLRAEKRLSLLVTDQRFVATAGEWATEMERRGEITHVRIDGKTMHQWIDTKQLDFTKRGSENGWKTNYFVENIARFYAKSSVVGMEQALDRILDDFLAEGPGGDHYESIYHPDWNSVGLGYAIHVQDASERVYFVFHYGSLNPVQP